MSRLPHPTLSITSLFTGPCLLDPKQHRVRRIGLSVKRKVEQAAAVSGELGDGAASINNSPNLLCSRPSGLIFTGDLPAGLPRPRWAGLR
jgi:hypothetical protein